MSLSDVLLELWRSTAPGSENRSAAYRKAFEQVERLAVVHGDEQARALLLEMEPELNLAYPAHSQYGMKRRGVKVGAW